MEVELSHKSRARLNAVLELHAEWIRRKHSPAVIYVCSNQQLADRVHTAGTRAGLGATSTARYASNSLRPSTAKPSKPAAEPQRKTGARLRHV